MCGGTGGSRMEDTCGGTVAREEAGFWAVLWDWVKTVILCAALALPIRFFVLESFTIEGSCMEPTLFTSQRVFVFKLAYALSPPARGDIIVFRYPLDPSRDYIKRVIALPGERVAIRDGNVYINGRLLDESAYPVTPDRSRYPDYQERVVPEGTVFVLGDNRPESEDSRIWGFVPQENIKGRAFLLWWPLWRAKWLG